jgi:hypothetical protein
MTIVAAPHGPTGRVQFSCRLVTDAHLQRMPACESPTPASDAAAVLQADRDPMREQSGRVTRQDVRSIGERAKNEGGARRKIELRELPAAGKVHPAQFVHTGES